jgi:hypothetical protein
MQKPALKTDWYHMLVNWCIETRVKIFFPNFLKPCPGLENMKIKLKKELGRVFLNSLIPRPGGYHKN